MIAVHLLSVAIIYGDIMTNSKRLGVIYSITCTSNNVVYIGSTIRSPRQRHLEHLHYLRKNKHHSRRMQFAYNKYGESAFVFAVIEKGIDHNMLLAREQFHIWRYKPCAIFNSEPVSDGILAAVAARLKKGQSDAEKAKRKTTLQKTLDAGLSRSQGKWSDKRKAEHSIHLTGRKMPTMKDSTKKKISDFHMGRECPPDAIANSVATRTAFIEKELPIWIELKARGLSYRKIELKTGRCRRVIARECARAKKNETRMEGEI